MLSVPTLIAQLQEIVQKVSADDFSIVLQVVLAHDPAEFPYKNASHSDNQRIAAVTQYYIAHTTI
jgi:hypothetical protein